MKHHILLKKILFTFSICWVSIVYASKRPADETTTTANKRQRKPPAYLKDFLTNLSDFTAHHT